MAQVCGGTTYDFEWDRTLATALPILRTSADRWACNGANSPSVEKAAALLVRVFVSYWRKDYYSFSGTFEQAMSRVESLEQECQRFPTKLRLQELAALVEELVKTLEYAALAWSDGDPEDPATEHVLNWIVDILFQFRLIRRPAKPSWPKRPALE